MTERDRKKETERDKAESTIKSYFNSLENYRLITSEKSEKFKDPKCVKMFFMSSAV